MSTRLHATALLLSAAVGVGAVPGDASAGSCSWQLGTVQTGFVPDLDQIRQGFPSDGYAYCVPTATINWMAWIDSHGHPSVIPFGPQSWQSPASFNNASAAILEMGAYMNTHATDGTGGQDTLDGIETWLDTYADPDDFLFGRIGIDEDYVPGLDYPWTGAHQGALMMPVIGWYKQEPFLKSMAWFRKGGHIVSLNGLHCNDQGELESGAEMWFRDPADDVFEFDLSNQSQFFTRQHTLTEVSSLFSFKKTPQPGHVWPRSQFRVDGYAEFYGSLLPDQVAYYEGFIWVKPMGGYTIGPNFNGLTTHDPNQLDYIAVPPTQSHPAAQSLILSDVSVDLLTREHVLLARLTNGQPDPSVRALNTGTGVIRTIFTGAAPWRLTFDRFGNLYLLDGAQLVRVDRPGAHEGSGPPPSGAMTPPAPMDALAWDSRADAMYAYSRQSNVLARYPRVDTAAAWAGTSPMVISLPGDAPAGEVHIATDPRDGCIWITGVESRTATKYAIDATTGAATIVDSMTHVDLSGATGLDVSRGGRLFFVRNGAVIEFSKDGAGGWSRSAQTPFAGLPATGLFRLERGGTNLDPDPDDTFNVVPGVSPCVARGDFDEDGDIDAGDLAVLLGAWGGCAGCAADLNGDGVVNGQDLALLLGAWGPCD